MHPTPTEVVYQIINSYKPYAIGIVILAILWLFVLAKIKQKARVRKELKRLEAKEEAKRQHFNNKMKAPKKYK